MPDEPTSDASTSTEDGSSTSTSTSSAEPTAEELRAELEKWKNQARKNEDKAKANAAAAKDLEKLREQTMSEQEKAVAEAEARGRKAGVERLAAAELKAALVGRVEDPAAIVEDLNLGKFITEDGEVDDKAVAKLAEKYGTPKPGTTRVPTGARTTPPEAGDMNALLRSAAGRG